MTLQPSRLSRWLAPVAQLLAIIFLLVNAMIWLVPDWAEYAARHLSGVTPGTPLTLSTEVKMMGLLLSTLHLGILAYALFAVARIFRMFARGDWFSPDISRCLQRFGIALLLFGAVTPLVRALLTVIITMQNPPGQRMLAIGFSSNDFVLVLVGTLIIMLGYTMREAVRMADENRQIV